MNFEASGFIPNYEVEINPEFPGDGKWESPIYGFGRDGVLMEVFESRWGESHIAKVQPSVDPEWVGMFAAGGLGDFSGVFATPDPDQLILVASCLANLFNV